MKRNLYNFFARFINIRAKIIVSAILLAIAVCVLIVWVLRVNLGDFLVDQKLQEISRLNTEQARSRELIFERYQIVARLISDRQKIVAYMQDPTEERRVEVTEILSTYDYNDDEYESISLADKNGRLVVSTDSSVIGINIGFRNYFKDAMNGQAAVEALIGVITNKFGYFFAQPILDQNKNIVGVLVLKVNNSPIERLLSGTTEFESNKTMLVDKDGIIVFSSNPGLFLKSLGQITNEKKELLGQSKFPDIEILPLHYDEAQNIVTQQQPSETIIFHDNTDGQDKIIDIRKISNFPFYLVSEVSLDNIYDTIYNIIVVLIDLIILGVIIAAAILYFLITFSLRPLKMLEKSAIKIASGDFSEKTDINTKDEFGSLSRAFNIMIDRLRTAHEDLELKIEDRTNKLTLASKDLEDQKRAILNILEDVELQRNAFQELVNRFNLATKSAKIGVWEWDVIKNTLTWDDQMYELYGIKKSDFGGAYDVWRNGLHPDDRASGDEAIKLALDGKKNFEPIFRVVWPDGTIRYIKAHAIVQRDSVGKPVKMIGVNWDITKEIEIDKAKSEFVSLASHQLKTPVGAVKWDTEMLLDGDYGALKPKQKKIISEIYDLNARMTDLVNSFLNVSRIELGTLAIEPVPVKYSDVCDDVLNELKKKISDKGHKIVKKYQKSMPETVADPKLLRIVFQNLLSNAVKYTRDGGRVSVSIGTENKNIKISVANNGIPIPKDEQSKIFEKLFRATGAKDMDPDGNGLGLYLLKRLVEEAGGTVAFTADLGKDSVFTVTFPLPGMRTKYGTRTISEHEAI